MARATMLTELKAIRAVLERMDARERDENLELTKRLNALVKEQQERIAELRERERRFDQRELQQAREGEII